MRNILLSIRPKFANDLVDGIKTIELRRRFPMLPEGTKIYVYSTAPEKQVIGEVVIDKIVKMNVGDLWVEISTYQGIRTQEFIDYFDGMSEGYAIYVRDAKRYDKPLSLDKITDKKRPPQSFYYIEEKE